MALPEPGWGPGPWLMAASLSSLSCSCLGHGDRQRPYTECKVGDKVGVCTGSWGPQPECGQRGALEGQSGEVRSGRLDGFLGPWGSLREEGAVGSLSRGRQVLARFLAPPGRTGVGWWGSRLGGGPSRLVP